MTNLVSRITAVNSGKVVEHDSRILRVPLMGIETRASQEFMKIDKYDILARRASDRASETNVEIEVAAYLGKYTNRGPVHERVSPQRLIAEAAAMFSVGYIRTDPGASYSTQKEWMIQDVLAEAKALYAPLDIVAQEFTEKLIMAGKTLSTGEWVPINYAENAIRNMGGLSLRGYIWTKLGLYPSGRAPLYTPRLAQHARA